MCGVWVAEVPLPFVVDFDKTYAGKGDERIWVCRDQRPHHPTQRLPD